MVLDQPWPLNKALITQDTVSKGSLTPPPPLPCPLCSTSPSLSSIALWTETVVVRDPSTKVLEVLTLLFELLRGGSLHEHLPVLMIQVLVQLEGLFTFIDKIS